MIAGLLLHAFLGLTAGAPSPARADEVFYVDASLELDGRLLSWEAVRGLPGGELDLVLAVRKGRTRELRIHAVRPGRVEPVPRRVVPMLDDVVAWGAAELRDDPGRELLLLTPGGAFSYSLAREGYRDNALALARTELIFDLADPDALPRWRYVLPGLGEDGRAGVLLPERDALALWVPQAHEPALFAVRARFPRWTPARAAAPEGSASAGGPQSRAGEATVEVSVGTDSGEGGPFVLGTGGVGGLLLQDSHFYRAPALVDVDGDGRLDLVELDARNLTLHLGAAREPTRVEPLPAYLEPGTPDEAGARVELAFNDLDGDGDLDLLALVRSHRKGIGNAPVKLLVLLNDGRRLLPSEPSQILHFEASTVRAEVCDVDGDGRPDLVVRTFSMPSMMQAVTGPEFTLKHMVYFGERGGFARQPAVRHEQKFDESGAGAAVANYRWVLDCDGDGVADLCAVDLSGRVTVRRLRRRSSFLRGDRWELDATPWRSFDTRGSIRSLEVRDLNGDGLGDLISAGEERLAIFLSQRRGGR